MLTYVHVGLKVRISDAILMSHGHDVPLWNEFCKKEMLFLLNIKGKIKSKFTEGIQCSTRVVQ